MQHWFLPASFPWRPLGLAALLAGLASSALAWSERHHADVQFRDGSHAVQGESIDQLARLDCWLAGRRLEYVVVQSDVDARAPQAKRLGLMRAKAVKQWLVTQHGWEAARIVLNPGWRDPWQDEGAHHSQNVWVELTPQFGALDESRTANCKLLNWQRALLAGDARMATVVARSLLRTAWVDDPVRLFEAAWSQRRFDVVDALSQADSGIRLTPAQQARVAQLAWQHRAERE